MNFSAYHRFKDDEALTCQKVVVSPGGDDQAEGEEGGGGAQHRDSVLLCHVSRSRSVTTSASASQVGAGGEARQ